MQCHQKVKYTQQMCECVRLVAEMNSNMNLSTIGKKRVRETIWLA